MNISAAKKLVFKSWMTFGRDIGALLLQERSYLKGCVLLMNDIPEEENEKRH